MKTSTKKLGLLGTLFTAGALAFGGNVSGEPANSESPADRHWRCVSQKADEIMDCSADYQDEMKRLLDKYSNCLDSCGTDYSCIDSIRDDFSFGVAQAGDEQKICLAKVKKNYDRCEDIE